LLGLCRRGLRIRGVEEDVGCGNSIPDSPHDTSSHQHVRLASHAVAHYSCRSTPGFVSGHSLEPSMGVQQAKTQPRVHLESHLTTQQGILQQVSQISASETPFRVGRSNCALDALSPVACAVSDVRA
jgi:hypothetical protein